MVLEPLEGRTLLANAPFSVGGDPIVHPADFRITTFASGLNYPHGMTTLSDGSLLVAVNNPVQGGSFFSTTGELLRFTDGNGDGVADGPGTALFDGLVGEVTAVHQAGRYFLATSAQSGSERITVLRAGATPASPLTAVGSINFTFTSFWDHTTFASAVRPTPGHPGDFDVFFNIGSEFNGVVIGNDGNVVLDAQGNPTYQPTTDTVPASGLITSTLLGDSIYMATLHDNGGSPAFSGLTRIASGLRNAASMAIDPVTGDFYFADNGIDGNAGGNEAWSADELNRIPAAQIGGAVEDFGFPYSYVKTIDKPGDPVTVVNPNLGIQPLIAFEPLPDPVLTAEGSESEGPSGFALSPRMFPAGLDRGVFVGFHGLFNEGGVANDENPFIFGDPATGHYFDFISNNAPNIGHIDEALSTADSLFLADISSTGELFGANGPGRGVIYQIKAINHKPALAPIANASVEVGKTLTLQVSATDRDPGQTLTFSLGPGAPAGAKIDPATGVFTWTPGASSGLGNHSVTVVVTDNGTPALSDSRSFKIKVVAANHPPVVSPIPAQAVTKGQALRLGIAGFTSDPDTPAQALRYSLDPGAPAGARIDRVSGLFTWAPSSSQAAGTYSITVRATDNGVPALSGARTFSVKVLAGGAPPAPGNPPPVAETPPTFVSAQVSARRGLRITLTFSKALDASAANDPNNYQLVSPGRDRTFGTRDDRAIRLTPDYDPATNTVTLSRRGRVRLRPALRLTVLGTASGSLASRSGQLLDGDGDGRPGGDYVAQVARFGVTPISPTSALRVSRWVPRAGVR